jgi:DNA-binding transcriptional LysR family regulator
MDTTQLQTFLTIVINLNYSRTAEILNVTQPTVTARIKSLENELNCQLFHRDGKSFHLTPAGEIFKEYASKILSYEKESKEAVLNSSNLIIKIGFCPGFSSSFILQTVSSLKSLDDLTILVTEGEDSIHLNEQVLLGELDLVFTRNLVTHGVETVSEYLFDDKFVHGETLISYRRHHPVWSTIDQTLIGVKNLKRIEVRSNEMLKTFVKNGWGISFSPSLGIDESEKKQIIAKDIKEFSNITNKVYVIYRKKPLIEKYLKKLVYSFVSYEVEKSHPF